MNRVIISLQLNTLDFQIRTTCGLFTFMEPLPCAFPAHETLDIDDDFMRSLGKFEYKRDDLWKQLPTISRPCMKKAGVTITPRRMPSSTSS